VGGINASLLLGSRSSVSTANQRRFYVLRSTAETYSSSPADSKLLWLRRAPSDDLRPSFDHLGASATHRLVIYSHVRGSGIQPFRSASTNSSPSQSQPRRSFVRPLSPIAGTTTAASTSAAYLLFC